MTVTYKEIRAQYVATAEEACRLVKKPDVDRVNSCDGKKDGKSNETETIEQRYKTKMKGKSKTVKGKEEWQN
jgi:hypothetical protein